MSTINLLYQRQYAINDSIRIVIPTVGEILQNEDAYFSLVQFFTAQPIDFMVPLDDAGIDFTKINEWDLFLILLPSIMSQDTTMIFDGLDLSKFKVMQDTSTEQIVLLDELTGARIDRKVLGQIAAVLRRIHHLEKNQRKPANEEAKKYMIERARVKAKRKKKRKSEESDLESLIIAMVNTEQFKYDFDSVLNLTIYQFNESVRQIIKKVDYDNRMYGVYSGTLNPKELKPDDLNWLVRS